MTDYDVIIIGSGVGGAGIGAILASRGFKVLLIEKNQVIGGRCSTYEKEGFKIDVGVHSFGRTSRGPLGIILNMIGMENAVEWILARNPGPKWYHEGKFWSFPRELSNFIPPSDYSSLMKLFRDVMRIKNTRELDTISVKSWLLNYTKNPLIHSFMSIFSSIYLVTPYYLASAGEFIRCLSSLSKEMSLGYPKGGCISIPLAYAQGIKNFGGVVKLNTSAEKIVVEDNKVKGIQTDDSETILSNLVISNAGIRETANNLVGREYFDEQYLGQIDSLKYSMSAITFKIALKKPITKYKVVSLFNLEDHENKFRSILEGHVPEEVDLFVPIVSNYDPLLAPKGKQLIMAGTAVSRDNFEKNRDKWIKNSMKSLEMIFPDLPNNLLWVDITTPKDIESMGGKEGAVVGISQSIDQVGINRPSSVMPIKGLYIVGGDAGGWGIGTELAAQSAIDCAKLILEDSNSEKDYHL
ncbi:MAG: NAD(P)/FAD-dependent oxidoreductase [Promethearchaeota archaeon]|nr:MAG: NAD(P)/FAD-dependent oxidoreductase [Candidatus Lokiarchaeota archaeon]